MARRVTANNNPKNSVMTDLNVGQAAEVVRANPSTDFARDLVAAFDRYGTGLNGNKTAWLLVIAQQILDHHARATTPAATTTVLTDDFAGLTAIFTRAIANGKKYPKIALRTAGGLPIVLSLAGERSKYAGSVNITDGGKYPDNVYYGRVEPNGAFAGRDPGPDVMDLLRRFAADPQGVAAAYGRETGECCFCQAELTDERSVLQGYGPICADKHGLPWGDRPTKSGAADLRRMADAAPSSGLLSEVARRAEQQMDLAFASAERAQEEAGFASDPDYSGFRQMTFDDLMDRAAAVATRDGYLQPRAERLVAAGVSDSPWRDDD